MKHDLGMFKTLLLFILMKYIRPRHVYVSFVELQSSMLHDTFQDNRP